MIKLSNAQVNALAIKIASELTESIKAPIIAFNRSISQSDEYKNFIKNDKDCQILEQLYLKYNLSEYDKNQMQRRILNKHFEDKFQEVPHISNDSIVQEIHLATIDASDVATLIEAVSLKFK